MIARTEVSLQLFKEPGRLGAVTALQLQELERELEREGEQLQARRLMAVAAGPPQVRDLPPREERDAAAPSSYLLKGASWYF